MSDEQEKKPIILKKKKKHAHGHHGGAWKIAYADFVTAMMAFFLLMWLLNATSEEQKRGLADYFTPISIFNHHGMVGGPMGSELLNKEGALDGRGNPVYSVVSTPGVLSQNSEEADGQAKAGDLSSEELAKEMAAEEERQFKQAEAQLREAIAGNADLKQLEQNILIEQTAEGLKIQLIDKDKFAMFPLGSAEMYDKTRALLKEVSKVIVQLDKNIAISGHTDSIPYSKGAHYGNWELSTDRAHACRRALIETGVVEEKIKSVQGKSYFEPLLNDDPTNPSNRRISIVLLREIEPQF